MKLLPKMQQAQEESHLFPQAAFFALVALTKRQLPDKPGSIKKFYKGKAYWYSGSAVGQLQVQRNRRFFR